MAKVTAKVKGYQIRGKQVLMNAETGAPEFQELNVFATKKPKTKTAPEPEKLLKEQYPGVNPFGTLEMEEVFETYQMELSMFLEYAEKVEEVSEDE